MKKIVFIIRVLLLTVIVTGCKTETSFVNKETGIKVKLSGKVNSVEPLSLENKFSNWFYHKHDEKFTLKWDKNYSINNEVYIGMNFLPYNPFPDPEKRSRELIYITK